MRPYADNSLTFGQLSDANLERCERSFHPLGDWSPADWACAVAGEVGEACNLIKKQRRGEQVDVVDLADELADAVIYIDLLCARLGIDLGSAVQRKFDMVSDRVGSAVRLSTAGTGDICAGCGRLVSEHCAASLPRWPGVL